MSSKDRTRDVQNSGSTRLSRIAVSWLLTAGAVFFVIGIMTYGGYRPAQKMAPELASISSNAAAVSNIGIQISIPSELSNAPGPGR